MKDPQCVLECLGCGLELAKTVIVLYTFEKQAFNPYAATASFESILEAFEVVFEPS